MFILQDKKNLVDITEFRILDGSSTYLGRKGLKKIKTKLHSYFHT